MVHHVEEFFSVKQTKNKKDIWVKGRMREKMCREGIKMAKK
jgi:hypothetical protein